VEPAARPAEAPAAGAVELELPGGWVLRVPAHFEAESLARLLAVIEGHRPC